MNAYLFDFSIYSEQEIIEQFKLESQLKDHIEFLTEFNSNKPVIVQTSGTTGPPKTISFNKSQLLLSAQNTIQFFNLNKGDKALLCLAPNYIAGKMMIVRAIVGKLKLYIVPPTSNLKNWEFPTINFTPIVPAQLFSLIESNYNIKHLGSLLIGGAKVADSLINVLIEKNINAFASFGMTETLSHFAIKKLSPVKEKLFTCLEDFSISINDNKQLILNDNKISGKLITNDSIEMVSNKSFQWLGRTDNIINSGGLKLHPEIIENKIENVLKNRFIVSWKKDDKLGQKLVLVIEGKERTSINQLKESLSKYEVPKEIIVLKSFPTTANGKIRRIKIQQLIDTTI